jgi:hypothetical protein
MTDSLTEALAPIRDLTDHVADLAHGAYMRSDTTDGDTFNSLAVAMTLTVIPTLEACIRELLAAHGELVRQACVSAIDECYRRNMSGENWHSRAMNFVNSIPLEPSTFLAEREQKVRAEVAVWIGQNCGVDYARAFRRKYL